MFCDEMVLRQILEKVDKLMATVPPGLAALQTSVTTVQNLLTTQNTDITNLTQAITVAIASLSSSEDPQVQAAVQTLNAAVAGLQTNEATIEAQTTALSGAEAPTGQVAAALKPTGTTNIGNTGQKTV
jgi:hypothetical protein